MNQIDVKKSAERKLNEITDELNKYNFQTTEPEEKQYNYEFDVLSGKEKIKILVYFGKKGTKVIVQGNKNSPLYQEVYDLATGNASFAFPDEKSNEPKEYIGSDETGKGDVFGPVVTCAVCVNQELSIKFRQIGVRDSKDLSENQIKKISKEIKAAGKDNFEIISINPEKYNELYAKLNNINEILNWSHTRAIENLLKRKSVDTVITDKFQKKDLRFSSAFSFQNYNIIQEPKAEKYIAVAAASILARERQLFWFEQQKKNGLELKRGASEEVKKLVKFLIDEKKTGILPSVAKMNFKTVKNLI